MYRIIVSIVGGASLGGIYALVTLGIVLAYRATGTFNFAQGQLLLLPAFLVGAWSTSHSAPLGVTLLVALLGTGLVAALMHRLVLQRTTGLPLFMGVIATFGVASVLDGVMSLAFPEGQYNLTLPGLSTGVMEIFGARVAINSLQLMAVSFLVVFAVLALLRFTSLGRKIRAAGQDPILASQGGINVRLLHTFSWGLSGVLAAVGGIAYGSTHLVDPTVVALMLACFPAQLIGGLDSIGGALVGGLLIGILQGFVATYFGAQLLDVYTYGLLLLTMLVLPQGLFGTRSAIRV
ncbi:MAG: hypothetical protein JWO68_3385 [Actinomycetia bacterium]|nr:hypothetical protein [Actinomycetes bacterium]